MPIIFEGYDRPEALVNFPALLILSAHIPGFSYRDVASSVGADLRFTDAEGSRFLGYEIDEWDAKGKSYVWVQVPELSRNTCIWAYWGNGDAARSPADASDGATWSEGYEAVWHLSEDQPGTGASDVYRDSSPNANHGDDYVSSAGQAGLVGRGQVLNGGSDYIDCGNHASLNLRDAITIEAWVRHVGGHYRGVINKGYWTAGPWELRFGREGSPRGTRLGARVNTDSGSLGLNTHASAHEWHHVALVYDGNTVAYYLDGCREASGDLKGRMLLVDTPVAIGQNGRNGEHYEGMMDEVRISSVARSPAWVWASWMSQARNRELACYNAVVTNSGGATSVTTRSARLNGYLYVTGGRPTEVRVFWGDEDGGCRSAGWDNETSLGVHHAPGPLTAAAKVVPERDYYYRFRAVSSAGESWASCRSAFVTPSVLGASTEGITWVARCEGDTLPSPMQWQRRGDGKAEVVDGALRVTGSYRATWDTDRKGSIVVDARVRVAPRAKERRSLAHYEGPVGISVSNGRRQGSLVLCPDYISVSPDRFYPMDTTGDFHVYRLAASGRDLNVYVDGRLKIRGRDAFRKPATEPKPFVQFGPNPKPHTGEANWDFVRVGLRAHQPPRETAALTITLSDPWEIRGGSRFTRPSLYSLGEGLLLMSVAGSSDRTHDFFSLLKSIDQGKTWTPVQGLDGRTFAPQSMVRLDDGSILGICRRTVHCLNSHSGRCVAIGGICVELDRNAESFRTYESKIQTGPHLNRQVTFGRSALKLDDGSVLATAFNDRDGCFLLRTADRGKTWHVFSKIAAAGEPSVAFLSQTDATALLPFGPAMPFRQLWSHDGGKTWSKPAALEEGCVLGTLIHLSSGVLACSYGGPGCSVMFSTDAGKTWGDHRVVCEDSKPSRATICGVAPDRLLYIYDAPPLIALQVNVGR